MLVSLFLWIVLGALVGWIASMIMKTDEEQGALANVVIGIIGAAIGGFLWTAITGDTADSLLGQLIVAVLGAMLVIGVWKSLTKSRSNQQT
jgi:uncharacterized membrane protein YeaQ/YmgE (transglycosylase-associated protein family)